MVLKFRPVGFTSHGIAHMYLTICEVLGMYLSTFLRNPEYLYSSTFQKYFDFQVLFEYIKVLLAFIWHYFPNTKMGSWSKLFITIFVKCSS